MTLTIGYGARSCPFGDMVRGVRVHVWGICDGMLGFQNSNCQVDKEMLS